MGRKVDPGHTTPGKSTTWQQVDNKWLLHSFEYFSLTEDIYLVVVGDDDVEC